MLGNIIAMLTKNMFILHVPHCKIELNNPKWSGTKWSPFKMICVIPIHIASVNRCFRVLPT